jgi:hypothetical protein
MPSPIIRIMLRGFAFLFPRSWAGTGKDNKIKQAIANNFLGIISSIGLRKYRENQVYNSTCKKKPSTLLIVRKSFNRRPGFTQLFPSGIL